jgi:hypothetical protein
MCCELGVAGQFQREILHSANTIGIMFSFRKGLPAYILRPRGRTYSSSVEVGVDDYIQSEGQSDFSPRALCQPILRASVPVFAFVPKQLNQRVFLVLRTISSLADMHLHGTGTRVPLELLPKTSDTLPFRRGSLTGLVRSAGDLKRDSARGNGIFAGPC